MKRTLLTASVAIVFNAGCVQIKTPDNLVSDSYHTSKEIYHDIKESIDPKQKPTPEQSSKPEQDATAVQSKTFTLQQQLKQDQSIDSAMDTCFSNLTSSVKLALDKSELMILRRSSYTDTSSVPVAITCEVQVAS